MEVPACGRVGCSNAMCSRTFDCYYICDSCYDELLKYKATWPTAMTRVELLDKISEFFGSVPGEHEILSGAEIDAAFDDLVHRE